MKDADEFAECPDCGWVKMPTHSQETVNHPDHYNKGIETIDYIQSWDMGFTDGNIIKYVTRYRFKGGLEDLKKAQFYLERLISDIEEFENG